MRSELLIRRENDDATPCLPRYVDSCISSPETRNDLICYLKLYEGQIRGEKTAADPTHY